jgi:hypothetical protein
VSHPRGLTAAGAAVLACGALLVAALPGVAAGKRMTFGSSLSQPPTETAAPGTCDTTGTSRDIGKCTRVALGFPATGTASGGVQAPVGGVIRRIRVRSAVAGTVRVTLARVRKLDRDAARGQGRAVSKGALLRVRGRGLRSHKPVESFRVHLRVRRGDYLALRGASFGMLRCQGGDVEQLVFAPPLRTGKGYRTSNGFDSCTALVQAVIR